MISTRKESLEISSFSFPDSSLKNLQRQSESIASLDGSSSPFSPGLPGEQDIPYELADLVQIEGTKVASYIML